MTKVSLEGNNWVIKYSDTIEKYPIDKVQLRMENCTLRKDSDLLWVDCKAAIVSGNLGLRLDSKALSISNGEWTLGKELANDKTFKSIVTLRSTLFTTE